VANFETSDDAIRCDVVEQHLENGLERTILDACDVVERAYGVSALLGSFVVDAALESFVW
jgi:hypothetical protein